jgi:hypothetical protein
MSKLEEKKGPGCEDCPALSCEMRSTKLAHPEKFPDPYRFKPKPKKKQ